MCYLRMGRGRTQELGLSAPGGRRVRVDFRAAMHQVRARTENHPGRVLPAAHRIRLDRLPHHEGRDRAEPQALADRPEAVGKRRRQLERHELAGEAEQLREHLHAAALVVGRGRRRKNEGARGLLGALDHRERSGRGERDGVLVAVGDRAATEHRRRQCKLAVEQGDGGGHASLSAASGM